MKTGRGHETATLVTMAHLAPAARGFTLQLEPLSPAGAIFLAGEDLVAFFRAGFRGRYLA